MLEFVGEVRDDNSLVVTTVAMDCDELICGELGRDDTGVQ